MEKIIHRAGSRGHANHGWLNSYHSFSFAEYYDPERINFGALRVLNDDTVAPGRGFGAHPHQNMEIISIPLQGSLLHQDSMGNKTVINTGDVQIMSAGSGITHSEHNASDKEPVQFLQIWLFPKLQNIKPRYDQVSLQEKDRLNKLQLIVSPDGANGSITINQQAWFYISKLDKEKELSLTLQQHANGLYIFVLDGSVQTAEENLSRRDGIGLTGITTLAITSTTGCEILLMEVPMYSGG